MPNKASRNGVKLREIKCFAKKKKKFRQKRKKKKFYQKRKKKGSVKNVKTKNPSKTLPRHLSGNPLVYNIYMYVITQVSDLSRLELYNSV